MFPSECSCPLLYASKYGAMAKWTIEWRISKGETDADSASLSVANPGRLMTWICELIGVLVSIGKGLFINATDAAVVVEDDISDARV